MSSCRIYEEDTKAHYKAMNERKGKGQQSRTKPYSSLANKGKQRVNDERRPGKKDTTVEIVCYTCGACNTPFSQHKNFLTINQSFHIQRSVTFHKTSQLLNK